MFSSITSNEAPAGPLNDSPQDRFDKETFTELFQCNPMKRMRIFNVHININNIAAATFLVESLRKHASDIKEIGKLIVKVQLPQNNYGSHEEILEDVAKLMQQMRKFKVYCETQLDETKVKWDWEKVGIFQTFAEIEQLNAMVEPINIH